MSKLANQNAQWKSKESLGLSKTYSVTVPYETFKEWAEDNKNLKEIKGFRPGKAPISFFKDDWALACARNILLDIKNKENLGDLLDSGYSINNFEIGKEIEITISLELYPTVPNIDFPAFKIKQYHAKIKKENVKESMQKWASSHTRPVDLKDNRKTQLTDYIQVDVTIIDPSGKSETLSAVDLILGQNKFQPEIEAKLVGKELNEVIEHEIVIPADNPFIKDEKLVGQHIKMEFTITQIRGSQNFNIDKEMALFWEVPTIEALEEKFESELLRESKEYANFLNKEQLKFELNKNVFEIPFNLIRAKYEQSKADLIRDLGYKNDENLEEFIKNKLEIDAQEFEKRLVFVAESAARLSFLLRHYARIWNISISPIEFDEAMTKQKDMLPGGLQAVLKFYEDNEAARNNLHDTLLEDKVLKQILLRCGVEDIHIDFEKLFNLNINDILGIEIEKAGSTDKAESGKNLEKGEKEKSQKKDASKHEEENSESQKSKKPAKPKKKE